MPRGGRRLGRAPPRGYLRGGRAARALRPLHKALLGAAIGIAGVLVALLYTGVYLIADCGPQCEARGERLVVIGLIVAGLVGAGVGGWMFADATRGANRKSSARQKKRRRQSR